MSPAFETCTRRAVAIPRCTGCAIDEIEEVDCGDVRDVTVLVSEKHQALLVDSDHGVHLIDEAGRVTPQSTIHGARFVLTDEGLVVTGERWMSSPGELGFVVRDGICRLARRPLESPFVTTDGKLRGWGYQEWFELPRGAGQPSVRANPTTKLLFEAHGGLVSPSAGFRIGWSDERSLVAQRWGEPERVVHPKDDALSYATPVAHVAPRTGAANPLAPVVGWLDSDVDEGGGRLHDAAGFDRFIEQVQEGEGA